MIRETVWKVVRRESWSWNIRKHLDSPYAIYLIVGFGLMLRVALLAMVGSRPLHSEAPGYEKMAIQLLHHERLVPYWPPGVPYYLLFAHRIFGEGVLVARASVLPVYIVFSLLLYGLVKEISSRRAANLAALIFAWYPPYVRYAFNPSTEYPAAACVAAIVFLGLLAARKRSSPLALALGLPLGALALIRPSSLLLIIFAPCYLFKRTENLRVALAPLIVALALLLGWLSKAHAMTGRFVMINESNWENFFMGNNPYTPLYNTCPGGPVKEDFPQQFKELLLDIRSKPQGIREGLYRKMAVRHILTRPDLFLLRSFNRFRAYFAFPVHGGEPLVASLRLDRRRNLIAAGITILDVCFYCPLMVLAVLFSFSFRDSLFKVDYALALLGTSILYAVPYWLSCSQPRYNFPVVPLFAVLAVTFLDLWGAGSKAEILQPIIQSAVRRRAFQLALLFFAYTQIEWALIIYGWV